MSSVDGRVFSGVVGRPVVSGRAGARWAPGSESAPGPEARPVPGARLIAGLGFAGGVGHLVVMPPGSGGWAGMLFTAMTVVCLGCAGHLARRRSVRALGMAAGMAAAMIVAHLGYLLMTAPGLGVAVGDHHQKVGRQTSINSKYLMHHDDSLIMLTPLAPELGVLALTGPMLRRRDRTATP